MIERQIGKANSGVGGGEGEKGEGFRETLCYQWP